MIDPLNAMSPSRGASAGDIVPSVSDPAAAHWLMLIGVAIIVATALWALGGLAAAVWTFLSGISERQHHPGVGPARKRR